MKSAKRNLVIWLAVSTIAATGVSGTVLAQREPGRPAGGPGVGRQGPGMPPPQAPCASMKTGTSGVFVLLGGTLVKYDTALNQKGTIKLFGPDADKGAPAEGAPAKGAQMPPMPRPATLMIAPAAGGTAEKVLVIAGDQFYSIDAASFKVVAKTSLPAVQLPQPGASDQKAADKAAQPRPNGPAKDEPQFSGPEEGMPGPGGPGAPPPGGPAFNAPGRMGQGGPGQPGFGGPGPQQPVGPEPLSLELQGQTLYIMRANQIIAVNIADGKVTAQTTLPKPAKPDRDK